ncbi:hypothetical protein FRC11_001619 [Ceratobasidium sp. 423]|nr:hypothetical protein FRC11_001619 [Ceratobasidium sp. 423]
MSALFRRSAFNLARTVSVPARTAVMRPAFAVRSYAAASGLSKDDIQVRVLDVLKSFEKVDAAKLSVASSFTEDLGLDSLDAVEAVMAIEEEFSIEIPDAEADEIKTVQQAIDYIANTPEGSTRLLSSHLSFLQMPVLPPDTAQLVLGPREWLVSLAEDVEKWLSKTLGISSKSDSVRAVSVLLTSGALLYLWSLRSRARGRPPIVSHWIPWLGSALQMHQDPDALLRKAQRELGPVFGVKTFGSVVYYIADADLINLVYKQTSVFSGSPMQATFLNTVFDMRKEVIHGSHAGIFGDMLASKNRHISPVNVHNLVSAFIAHTQTLVSQLPPGSVQLQELVILMQKADCAMLFGSSLDFGTVASAFEEFDRGVVNLAINFPSIFMGRTIAVRSQLIDRLTQYFESGAPEDASQQLKDFVDLAKRTFIFKGGDQVMCNMRGVHMDPNVYAHPEMFEPGRFADGKGMRGRFFPFGGGFSICEGRHLALSQIKAFLVILLSEFDLSLDDSQGVAYTEEIMMGSGIEEQLQQNRGAILMNPQGE